MANSLNVAVTAGLDKQRSVTQINEDIKKIEGQLKQLKLQAGLDKTKTAEINKQIEALNKQRKNLYVDLKIRKNSIKNELRNIQQQANTTLNIDTGNAQRQINSTTDAVRNASNETVTLANRLKGALNNAGLVISSQTALQYVRKAANEATEAVKEYDKYVTNLSVITGGSRSDSDKLIGDLAEKSLDFKVDISDLEGAEETLLRTGKTIDETNKYLENTVYLSKLGFQDMGDSASQLVTIGNAYEYTADEMSDVVDKFVKLDSEANVTAGKLAEGVAKSAQNAKLAGFNIDQLSASIAALKDNTGRSESEISNSLNMIFSRLQNVKLGNYIIEDEDGTEDITEALNDTEKLLNTMNIKLRDSKDEFRDIGELFTELSDKWDKFNSVQQSAIATTIAGARQRNTFITLIENWNRVQELTDVSLNSTGTAVQKYENYLESIEAKSAVLNTSVKELWNNLLPTDFVGGLTDAGIAVVQFTDKYNVLQTALKSAVFYGLAKGAIAAKNSFAGMITDIKNVSAAMNLATQSGAMTSQRMTDLQNITKVLTDSQLKLVLSNSNLSKSEIIKLLNIDGVTTAEAEQRLATLGLSQANTTATVSTFSLSGAFKALWATITANPIMALTIAFTGLVTIYQTVKRQQEEMLENANEGIKQYDEQMQALEELRQKYINIVDSEDGEIEKIRALNDWKQTLIDSYGFEKEALENINLEREKGLGLLDKEIKANSQYARDKWEKDNADQIDSAVSEIYYPKEFQQSLKEFYERYYDDVSAPVKQVFIKNNSSVTNAFDDLEQQKELYSELVKLKERAELSENDDIIFTEADQQLLDDVSKEIDVLEKSIEKYGDIYKQHFENKSISFFDYYKETNSDKSFETFTEWGKESYISWRNGLLAEAGKTQYGSELQNGLKDILQADYSEYEKYFSDLQKAEGKFLPHINLDSQAGVDSRNRIKKFIEDLNSEDLNILVGMDSTIFDKGIDGVKKAIEKFKSDQENAVEIEADTSTLSELKEEYDDLSKSADAFIKSQKSVKSALEEQKKHGQLSAETIHSLTEAGYAQVLSVNAEMGAVTFNIKAYEQLNEKKRQAIILDSEQQKSELEQKFKDESAAIVGLSNEMRDANQERREAIALEMQQHGLTMADIQAQISALDSLTASLDAPIFDDKSKSSDDPWKDEAESKIKEIDHMYEMGEISHEEYIDRLDGINQKYYANNTKYLDDFNKYDEKIYKARKDRDQDLFDQKIKNLEKEKDKALKNNDFDAAKASVNTQITETQKRIVELETSGKKNVDDEIKELNDDLADLTETLNDINSDEYEFNVSVKEDSIDELNKKLEKTGDTSVYDKQIGIYTDLINDAQNEISRLLDLGYSRDSDEIQKLVDEIDGYYEDINDIYEKQTEAIKSNVDEQITALDRKIENTGDTGLYSEKIKAYEDGQQQILDRIKFYREQGYAEDSEIIKGLKEQWNDYADSINDTRKEQADAQVEAYNEILDKQKEVLEKQKKEQDEIYDNEIKLLKNKKTALEQVNKEIEKENELEEKRQALAEAERNMYKNVRLTYAGNGQWVQKARDEDLKAVKDAEKDLSETAAEQIKEKEIEAIEKQITALEESKNTFDDSIEKQITAIEDSEKAFEEAMKESYEVRKQLDKAFISSVVGEDKANEYLSEAGILTANTETPQTENKAVQTDNKAAKTDNSIPLQDSLHKTSYDDAFRSIYDLLNKKGALLNGATFDKFLNNINTGLLPSMQNITPKIADDTVTSDAADNITFNNKPVITNNITVTGNNKSDKELANEIAETCETKISQAFTAFGNEFSNGLKKKMYGN